MRISLAKKGKENTPFNDILKSFEKAFKKLFEKKSYRPEDLLKTPEYKEVIQATSQVFSSAITHEVPQEMKAYLEKDAFVFSGLKTHAQLTEARSFLKDENGHIVPFYKFEEKVLKLNEKYNKNYLEAEYQFAVSSSQSAANWANLQEDTERYSLEYRTAGDEKVRQSHANLNGICLPKNDPFWQEFYPPNGWRCRCIAVEVLAKEKTPSNSKKAILEGEKATTQISKTGKNKLAMFRFNAGLQGKLFPPDNSYTKVVGAGEVKKALEKEVKKPEIAKIDLNKLIKGEFPTNTEIKNILFEYASLFKEDFRGGLKEVKFTKTSNFLMQHSMSYRLSTNEWVGGSTLSFSTNTFGNGFNPAEELRNALGNIKKGNKLTFNQEYAMESLWHEILHAKTKSKPVNLNDIEVKAMETTNQFVARHTYNNFIERLGGKAYNQEEVLDKGYGYSRWIKDFREKLKTHNISEQKALDFLTPYLMSDYKIIHKKINELFNP